MPLGSETNMLAGSDTSKPIPKADKLNKPLDLGANAVIKTRRKTKKIMVSIMADANVRNRVVIVGRIRGLVG